MRPTATYLLCKLVCYMDGLLLDNKLGRKQSEGVIREATQLRERLRIEYGIVPELYRIAWESE